MISYRIAVLGGDGIGPEVVGEGLRVLLQAIEDRLHRVRFTYEQISVGAAEYLKNGDPRPSADGGVEANVRTRAESGIH